MFQHFCYLFLPIIAATPAQVRLVKLKLKNMSDIPLITVLGTEQQMYTIKLDLLFKDMDSSIIKPNFNDFHYKFFSSHLSKAISVQVLSECTMRLLLTPPISSSKLTSISKFLKNRFYLIILYAICNTLSISEYLLLTKALSQNNFLQCSVFTFR